MRLLRAVTDLTIMVAPIAVALVTIAAIFVWWPGAIVGLLCLVAVGRWSQKQTDRIRSEHHY